MTSRADIETFNSHGLWDELSAVTADVAAVRPRTDDDRHTVARVKAVAGYLEPFRRVSPYLMPSNRVSIADSLHQRVSLIRGQLAGWDQDAAMLPATVDAIDAACDEIAQILSNSRWPAHQRDRWTAAMSASTEAYRTSVEGSIAGAQADIQEMLVSVEALRTTITNLETSAKDREDDATTALTTITDAIAEQSTKADTQLAADLSLIRTAAEKQRTDLARQAQTALSGLEEAHQRGNDLVKKVADQSVGGEYLAFADREQKAYRIWISAGVASVVATFLFLGVVFVGPQLVEWIKPTTGFDNVLLKLGISISIAGFSIYAFREAGKRLRQSVAARYRALDVIALPPFIQDLQEEQQQNLRYLMGERLFGSRIGEDVSSRGKHPGDTVTLALDTTNVKNLAEAAKAVKDALGQ